MISGYQYGVSPYNAAPQYPKGSAVVSRLEMTDKGLDGEIMCWDQFVIPYYRGSLNTYRIVTSGSTLRFYVNGAQVCRTISDAAYTHGDIMIFTERMGPGEQFYVRDVTIRASGGRSAPDSVDVGTPRSAYVGAAVNDVDGAR